MSVEFDFLTPDDKPALLGLSTPELQDTAKTALDQLGYKVHIAANHGEDVIVWNRGFLFLRASIHQDHVAIANFFDRGAKVGRDFAFVDALVSLQLI